MHIAGIDLGTCQSCICIPAREGKGADGPVELILDEFQRKITPSVVTENSDGEVIVGHVAKQRAGLKPKPIFFIKRYMGTDHKEMLRGREMTPEEISSEILKHLKAISNKYLGEPVSKAVICVPAYFDLNQKEATKRAAKLAGLEVVDLLMEPIAAAYSYGLQDDRANLNVFCYDLGGGTFDATVLQKKDGETKVLAFGGDPYLGGCDFDKLLANYIFEKLNRTGKYKLDLDFSNDADDAKYQIMLQRSEKYKFKLTNDLETSIWEREIFEDQNGQVVDIDMLISRKEFEGLIIGEVYPEFEEFCKDYLHNGKRPAELVRQAMAREGVNEKDISGRQTEEYLARIEMEIQNRPASVMKSKYLSILSLMKSGLFRQEIDEIIMVGGSSYIPLVGREVENLFGKAPRLVDPDAIVARGAALKAAEYPKGGPSALELDRLPKMTCLPTLNISGRLDASKLQLSPMVAKLRMVRADQGYDSEAKPDPATGCFIFEEVELLEEAENHFQLSVLDDSNSILLSHDFSIVHDDTADPPPPDLNFITKPIYIETVDGLELMFKEGDKIPNHEDKTKKTQDQTGMIVIPIYEGDQLRGEIVIDGLNRKLPVGTPVLITIEVTKDLDLHGSASVPSDENKSGSVRIQIENQKLDTIEEMRADFEKIKDLFVEALDHADEDKRLTNRAKGLNLIKDIEKEFQNTPSVRPKIASMLLSLKAMIRDLNRKVIFTPSMHQFKKELEEARRLDKNSKRSKDIDELEKTGKEAYEEKDTLNWQIVNKSLKDIIVDLEKEVTSPPPPPPPVLALMVQEYLLDEVRALIELAQKRGVLERYNDELKELAEKYQAVKTEPDPMGAIEVLRGIRLEYYVPLEHNIAQGGKVCNHCGTVNERGAPQCVNCKKTLSLVGN